MDKQTRIIHSGISKDPATGASSLPVYLATTFHRKDVVNHKGYRYSRGGNPTRDALEKCINELEGGAGASAFSSGMAAINAALMLFAPGDHLVVSEGVYGGTYEALTTVFRRWGLTCTFADSTAPEAVRAAITPATRAVYVETPSNPLLRITDLGAISAIARAHNILMLVDNTFATPYLQRPLEFGADIVLHSATKFLNGHSDVTAGFSIAATSELAKELAEIKVICGGCLCPQDSWLLQRGMRTLGVRLEEEQKTAGILAESLARMPAVKKVYYPGLEGHKGREAHFRQASGAGAVLSFELEGSDRALAFLQNVKLPLVGASLGGFESILSYPWMMSHSTLPEDERKRLGISEGLLRLSVGLESAVDLLADFQAALKLC